MAVPILGPPAQVQFRHQNIVQLLLLSIFGLAVVGGLVMTAQTFLATDKPQGNAGKTADRVNSLKIDNL